MSVIGFENAQIYYISESNVVVVSNLDKMDYYMSVTLIPDANHNLVTKNISVKINEATTVKKK